MKRYVKRNIEMVLSVPFSDIVSALLQENACSDTIYAIDASFADVEFTEAVVKRILQSLRCDLNDLEWNTLIGELQALEPKAYE